MKYPGVCNKYGMLKVALAAYCLPGVANLSAQYFLSTGELFFNTSLFNGQPDPISGFMAGGLAFSAGALIHIFANARAHSNRMGMTEGSKYVRKMQTRAYAGVLLCSIGFNVAAALVSPRYAESRKKSVFTEQKAQPEMREGSVNVPHPPMLRMGSALSLKGEGV